MWQSEQARPLPPNPANTPSWKTSLPRWMVAGSTPADDEQPNAPAPAITRIPLTQLFNFPDPPVYRIRTPRVGEYLMRAEVAFSPPTWSAISQHQSTIYGEDTCPTCPPGKVGRKRRTAQPQIV